MWIYLGGLALFFAEFSADVRMLVTKMRISSSVS
jgi:hypothetical protein